MRGSISPENLLYEPELGRLERANRREVRRRREQARLENQELEQNQPEILMAAQENQNPAPFRRTLGEYGGLNANRHVTSIVRPTVEANNFEMKPALLHIVQQNQFSGSEQEDPNVHLSEFIEICDTIKINGASEDAIRLRLFPFSLRDRAKKWLQSQPKGSITTWDDLERKFLSRYFPPSRFIKTRSDITSFKQKDSESIHETWERFKELLRMCPNHGFDDLVQLQTFCNGLTPQTKMFLDASAGGSMNKKTAEEALELILEMVSNDYLVHHDRGSQVKRGILELDSESALLAQNKLMTQQLDALTKQLNKLPQQLQEMQGNSSLQQQVLRCDFCGGEHDNGHCDPTFQEEVNYMGNNGKQQGGNFYSNNQHQQGRNQSGWNSNFGQSSKQAQYQAQPNYHQAQPNFQPEFRNQQQHNHNQNFHPNQQQNPNFHPQGEDRVQSLEVLLREFMQATLERHKNMEASIKNLEVQMGQLAKEVANRENKNFSGNTQNNPREHCNAIFTRSGKQYGEGSGELHHQAKLKSIVAEKEETMNEKNPAIQLKKKICDYEPSEPIVKEESTLEKPLKQSNNWRSEGRVAPSHIKLPYPPIKKKESNAAEFAKFMEIFKKLHVNIPFAEALEQMPKYAKFMKDLLTKKRRFKEDEVVSLSEECSAIIQKKLPPKLKDPGSFTIPCDIGGMKIGKALCDLGASINLMPLSMWKRIGGGEVKPTRMSLQLADRSLICPYGIMEDILVKVGKFIFPADFVILDMKEDSNVPLILGRPFLATGRALIDVQKGQLMLRVNDEEMIFNVFETMHQPKDKGECFKVNMVDELGSNSLRNVVAHSPTRKMYNEKVMQSSEEEEKGVEGCLDVFKSDQKNQARKQAQPDCQMQRTTSVQENQASNQAQPKCRNCSQKIEFDKGSPELKEKEKSKMQPHQHFNSTSNEMVKKGNVLVPKIFQRDTKVEQAKVKVRKKPLLSRKVKGFKFFSCYVKCYRRLMLKFAKILNVFCSLDENDVNALLSRKKKLVSAAVITAPD